jgi:hypothetical protein
MKLLKPLPVLAILLLCVTIYLLTMNRAPALSDPIKMVMQPGVYTSMSFDELKKVIPKKMEYVKEHSTFLEPYDAKKFELLGKDLAAITGEQAVFRMVALPNGQLNYYRIDPLKEAPVVYTSFQFEQGVIGWYWVYSTFVQEDGSTASYMFYICRLDLLAPDQRKEMNLPMGSATYYQVSMAVGKGDEWRYSPFKIFRGEYTIQSDSVFSFKALDMPAGEHCSFSTAQKGTLAIDANWKDDSARVQGFNMNMHSMRPPFFNAKDGCAPCSGGAGTMYLSYTQLIHDGTITLDDSTNTYENGVGWNDRQWMNGMISKPYMSLLSNTMKWSSDKPQVSGLGKYLWLNLHLKDSLQYMIYQFFPLNEKITTGFHFNSIQKRYGENGLEDNLGGDVEVLKTTIIDSTEYPIKYKIKTKDGTYILDAGKFSKSVSLDVTNNIHWDGSALVYDTLGNMVGTGFLEANQFADPTVYAKNELNALGLPVTKENLEMFGEESYPDKSKLLPSVITLVLAGILILVLLFIIYRSVVKRKAA